MFAARIRVRSARRRSVSLCTPRAFSKSMLMDQLLFKLVTEPFKPGCAAALATLFLGIASVQAAPAARIAAQVEDGAREALQQRADDAGWHDARFDLKLVTG